MSITVPTHLPTGDRRPLRVVGVVLPAVPVLVDRDGDVWLPTDRLVGGERVYVCPEPSDPADQGDGASFPWTRAAIAANFGPLAAVRAEVAA